MASSSQQAVVSRFARVLPWLLAAFLWFLAAGGVILTAISGAQIRTDVVRLPGRATTEHIVMLVFSALVLIVGLIGAVMQTVAASKGKNMNEV